MFQTPTQQVFGGFWMSMIIIRGCVFSFGGVAWLPGGSFKHVFGMLIPIRRDHTETNKKWVAQISYKRATTKQLTIEIKSESETNVETDVDLGHQDVAMLLVGQLLCHRCHQFFSRRKGGCSRGKRRASLPTPPHFSGANFLLVWGFGSCWCLSDGMPFILQIPGVWMSHQ